MKKILSTLFTLVACVSLTFAEVHEGFCGDPSDNDGKNLTWSLDTETKTLTISGTGAMDNYHAAKPTAVPPVEEHRAPWYASLRNYITSVEFVNCTMTHIGTYAFDHCGVLSTVVIPASVSSIGDGAFSYCSSLTSVKALSSDTELGVKTIGASAFARCEALTSVTIPNATSIGASAFTYCISLTSFDIPEGVTVLNTDLFTGCNNLKSVTIPNVGDIKNRVFKGCESLVRIVYNRTTPPTAPTVGAVDVFLNVPGGSLFLPNATAKANFGDTWNGFHTYAHAATYDLEDAIANDYTTTLETLNDGSVIDVTLGTEDNPRYFLRNGDYNTLCLPFSLDATQLADPANPLYNFSIYEITDMYEEGPYLKFKVNQVSSVAAGKPYLMKYNGEEENIKNPKFSYVSVAASVGGTTEVSGKVTMHGVLKPTELEADNQNMLFLMAGNQLAWANPGHNTMKGFRAYFVLDDHTPYYIPRYRNLAPRIVEEEEVATDIELVENNEMQSTKVIENGNLYIIKNGVKYNVQGQVISK